MFDSKNFPRSWTTEVCPYPRSPNDLKTLSQRPEFPRIQVPLCKSYLELIEQTDKEMETGYVNDIQMVPTKCFNLF